MGLYRNPKTKQVIAVPENFDTSGQTGVDLNETKMVDKGYEPVTALFDSAKTKSIIVPRKNELVDAAVAKGWKRETDFVAPEQANKTKQGTVAEDEVRRISAKTGVPFEELDKLMEFVGANPNYREQDALKSTIGTLGRTAAGNIPQFLYREMQDPKKQQAISDLQELARERQSTLQAGAEFAGSLTAPVGAAFKVGKTAGSTAKSLATAVGTGGITGAATSKEGDEATGFAIGAGLNTIPGLFGAARAGKRIEAAVEKKIEEGIEKAAGKNIEAVISEARTASAPIIEARRAAVVADATPEQLMTMGERVAAKPNLKVSLEGLDAGQRETKLLELGQIDADHQTLKVAQELGWEGTAPKFPTMVGKQTKAIANQKLLKEESEKFTSEYRYAVEKGRLKRDDWQADFKESEARMARLQAASKNPFEAQLSEARAFINEKRTMPGGMDEVNQAFDRMTDKGIAKNLMLTKFRLDEGQTFSRLRGVVESVIDGKYVARGIDRRLGFNVEGTIQQMDAKTNQLAYVVTEKHAEIAVLKKEAQDAGLDVNDFRKYVENPERRSLLDPKQQEVVTKVENYFETLRQDVASMGFEIPKRENYFPHATPNLVESTLRLKARINSVKEATGVDILDPNGISREAFQAVKQADPDLFKAIQITNNTIIKTEDDLVKQARMAITPGVGKKPKQMTEASAAFLRNEAMPDFMLNNNLESAALNWVQETYRHVLVKDQLAELQRYRDLAKTAKDERAATYLDGLLDDLTGLRQNTLASNLKKLSANWQIQYATKAQEATNPFLKTWYGAMRDMPELFPTLLSQAYPNFLGLSPRAALMNLSQMATMTMPELGAPLFARHGLGALAEMAMLKKNGMEIVVQNPTVAKMVGGKVGDTAKIFDVNTYLINEGLLSQQYSQELIDALTSNARTSLPVKAFKEISNRYSKVAMVAFSLTESINRGVVSFIGKGVAKDLLEKNSLATDWLQRVEGAQRRKMWDLIQKGDAVALEKTVQQYLVSKTIFNYTRQSMSNFGRYMGPMFSMFTKWPSSVTGEIVEQYSANGFKRGTGEVAQRYLAPAAALAAIGAVIDEALPDSEGVKALTGSKGLQSWAPVTSVSSLASGDFFRSPALGMGSDLANALLNPQDPDKLIKSLDNAASTLLPGMAFWRVYENEISAMMGEKTEKPKLATKVLEATGIKEPKDVK